MKTTNDHQNSIFWVSFNAAKFKHLQN